MPIALIPNRSDHAMSLCYHRFSANGDPLIQGKMPRVRPLQIDYLWKSVKLGVSRGIGSSRLSGRLESRGAQASFCRHKTNLNALIERGGDSVEHRQGMTFVVSVFEATND